MTTKMSFCQNDVLIGESFWPKESLLTPIIFDSDFVSIMIFSLVSNFGDQSLKYLNFDEVRFACLKVEILNNR